MSEKRKEINERKCIGVIGAMEIEVEALKKNMNIEEIVDVASMQFCKGTYGDVHVVIVRSGIGKVNAGMCTQILADRFNVDMVINTGIAGSLQAKIDIGDIVVSTDALQHDMDATGFGYALGVIPQMETSVFQADEDLRKLAVTTCQRVNPDIHVYEGRVVSGDQFVSDQDRKDAILKEFQGCCTEMEGAAIAQAAYLNHIPFVIIRAISDKADGSATMDYSEFEAKAVEHVVNLMDGMLRSL